MERNISEERWVLANSTENAVNTDKVLEEDDEEETLSLSDLPIIHNYSRKEKENNPLRDCIETQEDFDFCSMSKESEMCAADEVFFQGQILPLRHSVSSDKGLLQYYQTRPVFRSESMDHLYLGGLISSRSSSISSSHQSSSSSGSMRPKLPTRNQFHSHPSPSPKIRFPTNKQGIITTNNRSHNKKSPVWNIFRLGLVTPPPEIAFQDLKSRCYSNNSKNLGSRNSTSSSSSNGDKAVNSGKKKKARGLLSGCKCSVDAVATVPSKIVVYKRSEVQAVDQLEEENVQPKLTAKKQMSYHRTFEWLKQLSVEGAADR